MKREEDIKAEIGKLPRDLKSSYDLIFERISNMGSASRAIAHSTINWLLCAQKSIPATAFLTAIYVSAGGKETTLSIAELLDICLNLVVRDTESNVFRFAHLSVREYFEERDDFSLARAHAHAFEGCVNMFSDPCYETWRHEIAFHDKHRSFGEYATYYWPLHLSRSETSLTDVTARNFLQPSRGIDWPFGNWNEKARKLRKWDPNEILIDTVSSPASPLFVSCCFGWRFHLEFLSELGAYNINQRNANGDTCLHLAAQRGYLPIVELLVRSGADLETRNHYYRMTALYSAAVEGHVSIVRFLHQEGASLENQNNWGRTPLHAAATLEHADMLNTLLELGSEVEAKDKNQGTALSYAAECGRLDVVSSLLAAGASTQARDWGPTTPLLAAIENRHFQVVEILLQHEANTSAMGPDRTGEVLQHVSKSPKCGALLQILLDHIAYVEMQPERGSSHFTLGKSTIRLTQLLFERIPHMNMDCTCDEFIRSVLAKVNESLLGQLLEDGADMTAAVDALRTWYDDQYSLSRASELSTENLRLRDNGIRFSAPNNPSLDLSDRAYSTGEGAQSTSLGSGESEHDFKILFAYDDPRIQGPIV